MTRFEDQPFTETDLEDCRHGKCCQCGLCCIVRGSISVPVYLDELCEEPPMECFVSPLALCPNLVVSDTRRRMTCKLHAGGHKPDVCSEWRGDALYQTGEDETCMTGYDNLCHAAAEWIVHFRKNRATLKLITELIQRGSFSAHIKQLACGLCRQNPVIVIRQCLAHAESVPTDLFDFVDLGQAVVSFGKEPEIIIEEAGLMPENPVHREFIELYLGCMGKDGDVG